MAYKNDIRWKKTVKGFTLALGKAGEHLTGWAKEWMSDAVRQSIDEIDADWEGETHWKRASGKISSFGGSKFYPWYTGQLHDSVAGIVSDKHKLVSLHYMRPAATKPQTHNGQIIIGREWGERAALNAARVLRLVPGIKATLVVGVPYTDKVNESPAHQDFLRELAIQFASSVEDHLLIRAQEYRGRIIRPD